MRITKKVSRAISVIPALCLANYAFATTSLNYVILDDPVAVANPGPGDPGTFVAGISGNKIVGTFQDSAAVYHGFVFDGTSYSQLDNPSAGTKAVAGIGPGTTVEGISGNSIVGNYTGPSGTHGYLYDGTAWHDLDYPNSDPGSTTPKGISGNIVVGSYESNQKEHGFIYDGVTWKTIDFPSSVFTYPAGYSNGNVVGWYVTGFPVTSTYFERGFIYNGTTFQSFDEPVTGHTETAVRGISGGNIVGVFEDSGTTRGFFDDGSTLTALFPPNATYAVATGVDGNNVVGVFEDASEQFHSFFVTVPEPSTIALLAVGGVVLIRGRWRKDRVRRGD